MMSTDGFQACVLPFLDRPCLKPQADRPAKSSGAPASSIEPCAATGSLPPGLNQCRWSTPPPTSRYTDTDGLKGAAGRGLLLVLDLLHSCSAGKA